MYTPEEIEKIEELRLANDKELMSLVTSVKDTRLGRTKPVAYKIGDKVFYQPHMHWKGMYANPCSRATGDMVRGTITDIVTKKCAYTNKEYVTYILTSVNSKVYEIEASKSYCLQHREVIDYSDVVVRDEIKKYSDDRLLKQLRYHRKQQYAHYDHYFLNEKENNVSFLTELKAELANRGHILRKPEKILIKKKVQVQKLAEKIRKKKAKGKDIGKELKQYLREKKKTTN